MYECMHLTIPLCVFMNLCGGCTCVLWCCCGCAALCVRACMCGVRVQCLWGVYVCPCVWCGVCTLD